jgi:hypothetical protein
VAHARFVAGDASLRATGARYPPRRCSPSPAWTSIA